MAQQRPEGIVQFYKEDRLDAKGNQLFKCEYCRQDSKPNFINDYVRMIYHLNYVHNKSEIMEDPKYQSVAARFNLHRHNVNQIVGECLVSNCNMKIKIKIDSGRKILNYYKIEDTEYAKCSFCRTQIPLEGLDSHPAVVLAALSKHLIPHIGKYSDILLKGEVQELRSVDEAFIQSELEKEENMQLEMNKKKQDIDKEVSMEETLSIIETEDLNTLLQRYRMKLNEEKKELCCEINGAHQFTYDDNKLYCIRNHWEIYHGPKNMIYDEIKNVTIISKLFRNYKITDGTLATCSECEYSENLEKDNELYAEILITLRDHWYQIHRKTFTYSQYYKRGNQALQEIVQEIKKKRREAATQISHPAERYEIQEVHSVEPGQDIPSEGVPETQETPETLESSEIRSTTTQSSATVENMPKQSSDSGDISVSGETQSPLSEEPSSKQIRLDSDVIDRIEFEKNSISPLIQDIFLQRILCHLF
ncbi:PREDICTED: uncharacterized protein LOC105151422 [Acromyrmex echinatior]|uniref:uncharacterized protein LOC105151422 n=1 Tax=Acromyrmex echinatior TaxID=103372 RepID=UPI000580F3FF|nr:PREDICTED: uncharacterized protein LOC105151422 [Acromyrmex echinatior]